MRDIANIEKINRLHPRARPIFQAFIEAAENDLDITLCIVSDLRSFEEQAAQWAKGRTAPGSIVTWSPPGSSYHNYGLAIDQCPYHPNSHELNWGYDFRQLQPYAVRYGITWGGNFPKGKTDEDHFELKLGYNWRDLLHKHDIRDFIAGTTYVNI